VLFLPGPLGGLAYLFYSTDAGYASGNNAWSGSQYSSSRASLARRNNLLGTLRQWKSAAPKGGTVTPIESARRARGGKVNCSRCLRQVDKLVPYEDGRVKHYACEMCVAEIELRRSSSISLKNLER
jgi:hypothetical protein